MTPLFTLAVTLCELGLLSRARRNCFHLCAFILCLTPQAGFSFGTDDHILYLPGHTETVEWSEEHGRVLFTCDYKNMQGVAPQRGEPCGPEPRLYFSKEDLQKLKYVVYDEVRGVFIYDNSRIIQRIYEKFPKLLIVIATDTAVDDSWIPEPQERGQLVSVQHPVDSESYSFYAEKVGRFLNLHNAYQSKDSQGTLTLGSYVAPFMNPPQFGFHPVEMERNGQIRPLADYALSVFPKNPNRTTIIHELLHHMVHLARERSIKDTERLKEMGVNSGVDYYLFDRLHHKPGERVLPEPPTPESDEELTKYIIRFGMIAAESADHAGAEEVEIRYFISKYGNDLGILTSGIQRHTSSFWEHVGRYEKQLHSVRGIGEGALMEPAYSFIRNNPHLVVGNQVIENYYHFAADDAAELAGNYPQDLLTRPFSPGSSMNYIKRFSEEFFPRPR